MYTTRNLNHDLYQICTSHYVRFRLLQDYIYKRVHYKDFVEQLKETKDVQEINRILMELQKIIEKIRLNGGKVDPDPVDVARKLRREQRLQEAFNTIFPYFQKHKDDKDALITFGWVMYDYLKKAEENIEQYVKTLTFFNNHVVLSFDEIYNNIFEINNSLKLLVDNILWSIRRVVAKGDPYANNVFPQLLRFCGNCAKFIEKRWLKNERSASRTLIREILNKLNDRNYLQFMDVIGFDWFDRWDFEKSNYVNVKGENIEIKPLAEYVFNFHSKKLLSMNLSLVTEQRINAFIKILDVQIKRHPSFQWLPFYKGKLLAKVNRKEEALEAIISFARTKSKEFWIWDLISELVEDEEKFNCLCAGILCKTKPEMIVGLQEKLIPLLIERKMFSNAKYELDVLISTRLEKWGQISSQLQEWKNQSWYIESTSAGNRDELKEFADKAEKILYRTLPFNNIFVTLINIEKGIMNFAYFDESENIKEGYAYLDSIKVNRQWTAEEVLKVKMLEDPKRPNLFRIFEVAPGNEDFRSEFIQEGVGYVAKENTNPFAFVDDAYISPKLVEKYGIEDFSKISYIKKRKFNKKKNKWGWVIEDIISVEKNEMEYD